MSSAGNDFSCSNVSTNGVTLDYWTLHDEYNVHGKVVAAFLLLFILFGLPWNLLVLITIIKEKLYHQPTIIFLLVLVLADIFILVVSAPILMATGFTGEFGQGLSDKHRCVACRIEFAFTSMTPMYSSFFAITLMAVDRFLYIFKPLQYDRLAKPHIVWVAVLVVALLTVGVGLALVLAQNPPSFYPEILSCAADIRPVLAVLAVFGAAGLIVITVCNVGFSYIVLKNIHAVYAAKGHFVEAGQKKSRLSIRHRKEGRLYLMFFAMLLTCIVSWVPILTVMVDYTVHDDFTFRLGYISFSVIIFYSQAIVDPFIETMVVVDVRKPLLNLVTCGLLKRIMDKSTHKEACRKKSLAKNKVDEPKLLWLFQEILMRHVEDVAEAV